MGSQILPLGPSGCGGRGGHWRPSCCWATLPSLPRTQPCPRRPGQTSHSPDPQDTAEGYEASDTGPGMVKPLLQASCGLHSLLNPSSSRNVPASVKSGPSSSVCSRQSPADATCSALVRTAGSHGGRHLGRKCLPSQALPCFPGPAGSSAASSSCCQGRQGWLPAATGRADGFAPLLPAAHTSGQVTNSHPSSHQFSLPPSCLPSMPSLPYTNLILTFSGLKSSMAFHYPLRQLVWIIKSIGLAWPVWLSG